MYYQEYYVLQSRGAIDPGPDEKIEGTLLVGEEPILHFYDNQSSYGEDSVYLFAAFHHGGRCWLKRAVWDAASGYSASGTQETIIDFEAGVKLLIERGVFSFPKP